MLCNECKINEATVRVVTDINGVKSEIYLCESCAKRLHAIAAMDFAGAFSPFGGYSLDSPGRDKVCRSCGTRLSQFNSTGYVGCENCYREFEPTMQQVISRVQGTEKHRGKFPKRCGNAGLAAEYEGLSEDLRRAKDEDRFEDAMRIHARMKEIKEKLEKSNGTRHQ